WSRRTTLRSPGGCVTWATGRPRTRQWQTATARAGSIAGSPGVPSRGHGSRFRSGSRFCAHVFADLLDGPVVAVGVGEEGELSAVPGVHRLDGGDVDAPAGQFGPGRLEVADDQLQARRGAAQI